MRFYDIQIFNAPDAKGNPGTLYRQYSSLKTGYLTRGA